MKHQTNRVVTAPFYGLAFLLTMVCSLFISNVSKAGNHADTLKKDSIYLQVDKQPIFPGGGEALAKFLLRTIKYPAVMEKREAEGRVIVQFVVEKDGALTDIKALKGPGYGSSEEAVRVMKLSPKWQPALMGNQAVRTRIKMPVTFTLKKVDPRASDQPIKIINGG